MAGVSADNQEYLERDSRKARKLVGEARAHHIWYVRGGPDVIYRQQIGSQKMSFEAEDAFDISCDNVPHSLNRNKRWEKLSYPEQILQGQSSNDKTSYVEAWIPGTVGKLCMVGPGAEVGHESLVMNRGGVKKYVEVDDDNVAIRKAKGSRANLVSLQSDVGPGPQTRTDRHKPKKVKGGKAKEGEERASMSDPSDVSHVRYSSLEKKTITPKDVERAWRAYQPRGTSHNSGWRRKPAADHLLDWYNEDQEEYEEKLDAFYEYQEDSENPLMYPIEKPKKFNSFRKEIVAAKEKEEEFPLRDSPRVMIQKKRKEDEQRDRFVELRTPIASAPHLERVFNKAKEWFNNGVATEFLPVFPKTAVLHKKDSENILGEKMERCTFITDSPESHGAIQLYPAPRFCCSYSPSICDRILGWQSHARKEMDCIKTVQTVPEVSSSSECPICKKTEETEETEDTVVVKPLHLFSLSCGHLACPDCWLNQARLNVKARSPAITCANPHCDYKATVTEAAALFSDGTLDVFRELRWESLLEIEGSVQCHACKNALIPSRTAYSSAALCPCGARTCQDCGQREHLPISCDNYQQWIRMREREGIDNPKKPFVRNPTRHLTPEEKLRLKNCYSCGAEGSLEYKQWCDKCCATLLIYSGDPIDTKEQLAEVLEARAKFMDGVYLNTKSERRQIDKKKALALENAIEEGVFLFELITISETVGFSFRRKTDKADRQKIRRIGSTLADILYSAMESGGEMAKKTKDLNERIEDIRKSYAIHM